MNKVNALTNTKYLIVFFLLLHTFSVSFGNKKTTDALTSAMTLNSLDRMIVERILTDLKHDTTSTTGILVVKVGKSLLKTPYVASTLEGNDSEKLVINLRELDCTTFAENCLALARTIKSQHATFEKFQEELLSIRYRDGRINQYPSRLHYFSDWIYNNAQKGVIVNLSEQIGNTLLNKKIDFMTQHVSSYATFKNNPAFINIIAAQEAEITNRKTFYIPKDRIATIESQLQDGDILGLTTAIKGLDVSHIVIVLRIEGKIHILHASQKLQKVVVSKETLEEYLNSSQLLTGIMVARPD